MQSEENTKPVVSDCVMGCMRLFFLGTSKRRRKDESAGKNVKRTQHELDNFGLVPLPVKVCYTCNRYTILRVDIYSDHIHHTSLDHLPCLFSRSCRLSPLVQCDYCPLLFHMDCLDPPLTAYPTGRWMCPNHIQHLVVRKLVWKIMPYIYVCVFSNLGCNIYT